MCYCFESYTSDHTASLTFNCFMFATRMSFGNYKNKNMSILNNILFSLQTFQFPLYKYNLHP